MMPRKKIKFVPVAFRLRCSGHLHTIRLTENGALVLADHTCAQAEQVLTVLSGTSHRCEQVRQLYIKLCQSRTHVNNLPQELRKAVRQARRRHDWREGRMRRSDPLKVDLVRRTQREATRLLRTALLAVLPPAQLSEGAWSSVIHTYHELEVCPGLSVRQRTSRRRGSVSQLRSYYLAQDHVLWFRRVWRQGLHAVKRGIRTYFVVDAVPLTAGQYVASVIYQARKGGRLRLRVAEVGRGNKEKGRRGPSTWKVFRWLDRVHPSQLTKVAEELRATGSSDADARASDSVPETCLSK